MHILFFLNGLTTGGAERVTANLCNHWAKAGHEVTIVTLKPTSEDQFELHPSIRRMVLGRNRPSRTAFHGFVNNALRLRDLRRCIADLRPDVAISMMVTANCLLALTGSDCICIGSERLHPPAQPINRFWNLLRKRVYRHLDVVVAQTHQSAEWLSQHTNAKNITVIPNPIVLPLPDNDPNVAIEDYIKPDRNLVLAVGRLVPQKGFLDLIGIFAKVRNLYPNWDLTILGEGPDHKSLEHAANSIGMADRVILPGRVGNLSDWYNRADILALTSFSEGFPNALLEAMAHGAAVISYDCPTGPSDLITDQTNGLLIPLGKEEHFQAKLGLLMQDAALRRRLGNAAKNDASAFEIGHIAGLWEAHFAPPD